MPVRKAAIKDLRQNKKRAEHNRKIKSDIVALTRKMRRAITAKDAAKAGDWSQQVIKKLDKAAARKVIAKNTAARTKSRLIKAVAALSQK